MQLRDVEDADRFRIIEAYRQQPVLWCKAVAGTRDAVNAAWTAIAAAVSSAGRRFGVTLVQKMMKNMRDQHTRLLRRGAHTSWKFMQSLDFLGVDPPPPRFVDAHA